MIRQDIYRIDPKRRNTLNHRNKQFASPQHEAQVYEHRLNFYDVPPTDEITLEEFEQWAIDRLRSTLFDVGKGASDSLMNIYLQFSQSSKHARSVIRHPKKRRRI